MSRLTLSPVKVPSLSPLDEGGKGDGITDDYSAIMRTIDKTTARGGSVDLGNFTWFSSQTLLLSKPTIISGMSGFPGSNQGAVIIFPSDVAGMVVQTNAHLSRLSNFSLMGTNTQPGVNRGLEIQSNRWVAEQLFITGFGERGFYVHGDAGSNGGNANVGHARVIRSYANWGTGFGADGTDSNVVVWTACDASGNHGFGYDIGPLCYKHSFVQCHGNGNLGVIPGTSTPCDYVDRGSSNLWLNPYSESSHAFWIDTDTSHDGQLLSVGASALPTVWSGPGSGVPVQNGAAANLRNWIIDDGGKRRGKTRWMDPSGVVEWRMESGSVGADIFSLTQQSAGKRVLYVTADGARIVLGDPVDFDTGPVTGTKFGINNTRKLAFYGATPVVQRVVSAAAVDAASTQTLANSLRQALIDLGLAR